LNDNEEKEYNDIESLAAYLHSGKMQAFKAAEERAEKGLPPEAAASPEADSLSDVLFTSNSNKKSGTKSSHNQAKRTPAKRPSPAKKTENTVSEKTNKSVTSQNEPEPVKSSIAVAADLVKKKVSETTAVKEKKKNTAETSERRKERTVKEEQPSENIPALSESLSESLGMKAAEIAEQNKNALPPEDTPEVFDITEGSEQEQEFNNAATRLMNAVNDPASRNEQMREDMESEAEQRRAEKMEAARLRRGYERQKQSTRTLAYILIALVLCAGILGVSAYASSHIVKWALDFTGIASQEFRIDVEIPSDATIETVAAILSENNIISDAKFFKLYADFADKLKAGEKGRNTDFIAGKYSVSSTMSYSTLLSLFR